jgi:hypothetical protein
MSQAYEDFLYETYCPWCDEEYAKVCHYLGCPSRKPYDELSPRGKKQYRFNELLYDGTILELLESER